MKYKSMLKPVIANSWNFTQAFTKCYSIGKLAMYNFSGPKLMAGCSTETAITSLSLDLEDFETISKKNSSKKR